MSFEQQLPVTRTPQMGSLEITLRRTVLDDPRGPEGIEFLLTIVDQFGHSMNNLGGNLAPHLTPAQITALQDFMDTMWAKAEAEAI